MAGVDHAFQYSVEVKSRFSLFLDDSLNNEDPDLLLSKLQNKRAEKKKEKHRVQSPEGIKPVAAPKEELKAELPPKAKVVRVPKQAKPAISEADEQDHVDRSLKEAPEAHPEPQAHWRGSGGRGFGAPRMFRGSRGAGPRPPPADWSQDVPSNAEANNVKDVPLEPRARGRGRGFGRGRGRGLPYRDFREFDRGGVRRGRGGNFGGPRVVSDEEGLAPNIDSEGNVLIDQDVTEANAENELHDGENETTAPVDEEPKTYTLEEYKAMRSSAKPAVILSAKEGRKANDGKDVFANMVALRKVDEVSDDEVEEVEKEPEEPRTFDFDISYTDRLGERGRGSRGFNGRGYDRGRGSNFRGRSRGERGMRGGRGAFRGEARGRGFSRGMPTEHHVSPPAIYSDQDFPSLK